MKHSWKITLVLLAMFLAAQFIGLFVVHAYTPTINAETGEKENPLPKIFQAPEPETNRDFWFYFFQIIPAFIIAIFLILILTKYKMKFFIKMWFLVVIFIALSLAFNAFFKNIFSGKMLGISFAALVLALPLTILKIYRPGVFVHNFTELLIYPGIAAVFVPILNIWTIALLLVIISIYDMWAVWHSGIMQKMAKFQMEELKVFGGFFVPHISKKLKERLKKIKMSKSKNLKKEKIRVSLAILGGGDVVFPIIAAGVFLRLVGFAPTLFVTFGAFAGLGFLLLISQKKKFYPAMPFISAGIFLGMLAGWLIS